MDLLDGSRIDASALDARPLPLESPLQVTGVHAHAANAPHVIERASLAYRDEPLRKDETFGRRRIVVLGNHHIEQIHKFG
ncbi:MAG: hypothetical protein ACRDLY_19770 [Thermoleophilaceae bacterium]